MTFHIFQNSTTAYADEVIDNFYHIADGDRLPRGGQSLTTTDSVYDLGSSSNKWKNLHANTLYINNSIASSNLFHKIYSIQVSTSTKRIAVTGLNGDLYDYIICAIFSPSSSSSILELRMNQSSGTSDYIERGFLLTTIGGVTFSTYLTTSAAQMRLCHSTEVDETSCYFGYISGKSGRQRIVEGLVLQSNGRGIRKTVQIWDNTTDTLTSFSFHATGTLPLMPGSYFKVWEIER